MPGPSSITLPCSIGPAVPSIKADDADRRGVRGRSLALPWSSVLFFDVEELGGLATSARWAKKK